MPVGVSAFESFASAPALAERHGPVPDFDQATGRYRVRFAHTPADIDEVCRLRFRVFNVEEGEGLQSSWRSGVDRDAFDEYCQHLMVLDREHDDRVVGTYRLQVSSAAIAGAGFYSSDEFDLSTIPDDVIRDSIELGRACIELEHRNRNVLFLLWRGLAAYVLWHRKRYFFGCNSLPTLEPQEGHRMLRWLRDNDHVHPNLWVQPIPDCRCPEESLAEAEQVPPVVPPLFAIYLRYGSKVCSPPAVDRSFQTIDFFTVNDLAELDAPTFRKFADKR